MSYILNEAQQLFWRTYGYIVLNDFLLGSVKKHLAIWCKEITDWPEAPGKWMKYYEINADGTKQLCRMENFNDYHAGFKELSDGERTLNLISNLMGEPAVIFKEKINYKFPKGNGFKPHQDAPAFVSFNQKFHITMMIAIDACTIENGCLQVHEPGMTEKTLFPTEKDGTIAKEIAAKLHWVPIECQSGDIILFNSYVPHYSEPNHSAQARRAMFVTYNKFSEGGSKRLAYYKDKREKFPPDCERDPNKDYSHGAAIYNVANPITEKNSQ